MRESHWTLAFSKVLKEHGVNAFVPTTTKAAAAMSTSDHFRLFWSDWVNLWSILAHKRYKWFRSLNRSKISADKLATSAPLISDNATGSTSSPLHSTAHTFDVGWWWSGTVAEEEAPEAPIQVHMHSLLHREKVSKMPSCRTYDTPQKKDRDSSVHLPNAWRPANRASAFWKQRSQRDLTRATVLA